jgi:hypothetical protein
MTGVTEYALPETEAGRVHLAVEVGWNMVVDVGVTSAGLVSTVFWQRIEERAETELTGAQPTRCAADIVGVSRRIGKNSLYWIAREADDVRQRRNVDKAGRQHHLGGRRYKGVTVTTV